MLCFSLHFPSKGGKHLFGQTTTPYFCCLRHTIRANPVHKTARHTRHIQNARHIGLALRCSKKNYDIKTEHLYTSVLLHYCVVSYSFSFFTSYVLV